MPTSAAAKTVEARQKQSDATRRATLDELVNKPRSVTEFSIFLPDGNGGTNEVTLRYQAIGMRAYDRLVAKHPPKPDQRAEGSSFDMDSFAPALIAACSVDPEISPAEAKKIWDSDEWSRGDVMVLFRQAVELNNRGLDIPFSERG
jgi:hypothetical protein